MGIVAPTLLTQDHLLSNFDCGNPVLNAWLSKQALKNQQRNNAKVYVVTTTESKQVIAYYAIAMGSVQRENAIATLRRNSPNPIPMVILARLAVHTSFQGLGLGAGLLKDCVLRSVHAMNVVGGAGLLVHSIDDMAKAFYHRFGFKQSPFDPMLLMARTKDIEAAIQLVAHDRRDTF